MTEFKERSEWMTVEWWTLKASPAGMMDLHCGIWLVDSGMVDLKGRSTVSPSLALKCAG